MEADAARDPVAVLPPALVRALFARLPVDARLACARVCRSWHAALADDMMWARLDLSAGSGGLKYAATACDSLLRVAAARARGRLAALDVSGCTYITFEALLEAVTLNDSLRCLKCERFGFPRAVQHAELLALCGAQQLTSLSTDVACANVEEACALLRSEPPFAALRMRRLSLELPFMAAEAETLALAAALTEHESLAEMYLCSAPLHTPAALDAVVDAAQRLTSVTLRLCGLGPASAPALARLLGSPALRELELSDGERQLADEPAAVTLGDALRASPALTSLTLSGVGLWRDAAAAAALLGALTAHPRLRKLCLSSNAAATPEERATAGALLGALVAANSAALQELELSLGDLGEAGLGSLLDALPANMHLQSLIAAADSISEPFVRARLLPAVRDNGSLQRLVLLGLDPDASFVAREAEALVFGRRIATARR
jgi:hypothetical protein